MLKKEQDDLPVPQAGSCRETLDRSLFSNRLS